MDLVTVKSLNGTTFKVHNYSSEMSSSSTSKPQPLHSETRVISNSDTKLQLNNISITPGDKVDVTDIDSGFENDRPAPGGIVYKNVVEAGDFMIIHKSFWPSFIKGLSCSYCKQNRINVKVSDAEGFVKRILSKCESCDKNLANVYTSPKVSNPANHCSQFALNMQISDSLKSSGCGTCLYSPLHAYFYFTNVHLIFSWIVLSCVKVMLLLKDLLELWRTTNQQLQNNVRMTVSNHARNAATKPLFQKVC